MNGAYNAVAPEHITNKELTEAIAGILKKPLLLPNIPSWIMKLALGELGDAVLKGSRVSSEKIISKGYVFKFPALNTALKDCLG
jgi:uncharacterized protein